MARRAHHDARPRRRSTPHHQRTARRDFAPLCTRRASKRTTLRHEPRFARKICLPARERARRDSIYESRPSAPRADCTIHSRSTAHFRPLHLVGESPTSRYRRVSMNHFELQHRPRHASEDAGGRLGRSDCDGQPCDRCCQTSIPLAATEAGNAITMTSSIHVTH